MAVSANHIEAAATILVQIAFSGGEGSDPEARLAQWREQDGIEDGALEGAARRSADESVEEIEESIREEEAFSTPQLHEYLMREYMTAFQVGWIARARHEKRERGGE